jgi:hypothetical protein
MIDKIRLFDEDNNIDVSAIIPRGIKISKK